MGHSSYYVMLIDRPVAYRPSSCRIYSKLFLDEPVLKMQLIGQNIGSASHILNLDRKSKSIKINFAYELPARPSSTIYFWTMLSIWEIGMIHWQKARCQRTQI